MGFRVLASTSSCAGFTWQCFGSGGGVTGVASERRHQKLSPCPTELVPACYKTDPLLVKAEPVCDSGSAFGIMYLRKDKTHCETAAEKEE